MDAIRRFVSLEHSATFLKVALMNGSGIGFLLKPRGCASAWIADRPIPLVAFVTRCGPLRFPGRRVAAKNSCANPAQMRERVRVVIQR